MTPIRRALTRFAVAWTLLVWGSLLAAAKPGVLPYRLDVEVRSGDSAAPERVRRNLEIELIGELDQARCFESVARHGGAHGDSAELLLRVTIADVRRENRYDASLAQRHDPGAPPELDQGLLASVQAQLALELFSMPEAGRLREKHFSVERRVRPTLDADAKLEVEFDMITEVTRLARSWTCKGTARKLAREIAVARGSAASR